MFLTKKGNSYIVFRVFTMSATSLDKNPLKTINMPKRHILGWHILLPYTKSRDMMSSGLSWLCELHGA